MRHEKHIDATPNQVEHERTAMKTPTQKASVNHGAPQVAATPKPAAFDAPEAVKASNKAVVAKADARADGHSATKQQRSAQGTEPQAADKPRGADTDAKDPQAAPPASKQHKTAARPPAAREEAPQQQGQSDAADKGKGKGGAPTDNGKGNGGAPAGTVQSAHEPEPQAKGRAPKESKQTRAQSDPEAKDKDKQRE